MLEVSENDAAGTTLRFCPENIREEGECERKFKILNAKFKRVEERWAINGIGFPSIAPHVGRPSMPILHHSSSRMLFGILPGRCRGRMRGPPRGARDGEKWTASLQRTQG
jgi:hypothetical protein